MRRHKQIEELERQFDKDMALAPLAIRNKVAMIKFWLKTIELPMEDNFRQAYERAKTLFVEGNKTGVEVPKAIYDVSTKIKIMKNKNKTAMKKKQGQVGK